MKSGAHPIAEFRDADQYWQQVAGDGHEIIRPKPRRPVEYHHHVEAVTISPSIARRSLQMGTVLSVLKTSDNNIGLGSTSTLKTARDSTPCSKNSCESVSFSKMPNHELSIPLNCTVSLKLPNHEKINPEIIRDVDDSHVQDARRVDFYHNEKPPISAKTSKDIINLNSPSGLNDALSSLTSHSSHIPVLHGIGREFKNCVTIKIDQCPLLSSGLERDDWKGREIDSKYGHQPMTCAMHTKSPVLTDCGSLSKSSSDSDPVILRKRPPTKLKSRRRNNLNFPHLSVDELRFISQKQDVCEVGCDGSSSDENRSSGHASMSDSRASSSPSTEPSKCLNILPDGINHDHTAFGHNEGRTCQDLLWNHDAMTMVRVSHRPKLKCVPENERLSSFGQAISKPLPRKLQFGKNYRGVSAMKEDLMLPQEGSSGLEDIQHAIETLTLRSQGSRTSFSTSTYSSVSGSESEPVIRHLMRHSSLETINTNVTNADEFVWIDSHSRLVELQHLPWTNKEIVQVFQNGHLKDSFNRTSTEIISRLAYLLQRALVRIAREIQRFSKPLGICSRHEVTSALKVILAPTLADSCIKACLRAAAMYSVSGDQQFRQSKSARAGLQLSVGRFHQWMCDVHLGKFIHEYAAVTLTGAMENLLEEIISLCLSHEMRKALTASELEYAIANNGDLWGLLQPYSHLNSGRLASGTLAMPHFPNQSSEQHCFVQLNSEEQGRTSESSLEQSLLTTCVGNVSELGDLLCRVVQFYLQQFTGLATSIRQNVTWGSTAVHTLFYFMRCSQLEHANNRSKAPVQELVCERPYIVLPPLVEWVRIAIAHAEHRHSPTIDKDDVMQAARLLLPGIDCPVRQASYDEMICGKRLKDEGECARRFATVLAFCMVGSGRTDLLAQALELLPSTKINTLNEQGLTLLMLTCIRGDVTMVNLLLNNGADIDIETPSKLSCANLEIQHWTALTYATSHGHLMISKLLLEKGANVEGGARLNEDRMTVTPLQIATATGNMDMISLLLSHGADPFLSTVTRDILCYGSASQRGCYSALSVAAAHGQRTALHKLLSHPFNSCNKEVLSLEEILAEGAMPFTCELETNRFQQNFPVSLDDANKTHDFIDPSQYTQILKLNKQQVKALQEAMFHSAENCGLEITLDLRNIGIPWTLHCWMQTLATAYDLHLESVIDQLLQDFQSVWLSDCSTQFIEECLPLLFDIFQHSKNEGTSLLLADIFSSCFGKESIENINENYSMGGARFYPEYVNNPALSDIWFRVEGRIFYAHKIILVNASPCFKSLLANKFSEENPLVIQINDIRYEIFQYIMQYLYNGGCDNLNINQNDILELMVAANYFALDGLMRFCEVRCTSFISQENIVPMYLHAKIYNATCLMEYCQGFLIQNMVTLLTYDDGIRRLIFGKKIHNHDVLEGLLFALQKRIKCRHEKNESKAT